jgi:predicted enzyme related to lactoylglutathione lyase
MIGTLLFVVIVGLVLAVVAAAARDRSPTADPGIGTPRRFFLYALALIGLVAAANGAAWLLQAAVGALVGDAALTSDAAIALGVSLVGVGFPAWIAFWGAAQRTVRANPHEAKFLLRKLYLYGLLVGAAATAAVAAAQLLAALLGVEGRSPVASGSVLLAWAAVWAVHAAVERREPPTTEVGRLLRALHVYVLAVAGLAVLAVSLGDVLQAVLGAAYDALVGRPSLWATTPWTSSLALRVSGANALVAALVWWWFGHRQARPGRDGWPRDVATYAFGVFPGAVVVLSAASVLLYQALQVAFGGGAAAEEFDVLPGVLAALVVGGGLWGFHTARARADEALDPARGRAGRRANAYLLAAVGLVGVAVGLVQALSAAVGALAPATASLVGSGLRDAAILAATLLAVAGPLWGATWARLQRRTRAEPEAERPATSRRLYLTLAFGVGVAVALVAASIVVYEVVVALLDGTGLAVLWTARGSLATGLVAAAIGGYHGALLREDRAADARPRARPEAVVVRPGDVVVTRVPGTGPGPLAGVVYALDVERLADFYADVVELRATDAGTGYAHLTAAGVELFLVAIPAEVAAGIEVTSPPQRRTETPIKLAFPTSDLARARTAAAARGGVVDPPERAWTFGGYLHCDGHDPEGNVFQLREAVG